MVHEHIADDIRAGWDNHLAYAREHPNFYRLMWSPAIAARSVAVSAAYEMLRARLELGAGRGQLRVSPETATRTVMAAVTGAAMSLTTQPDLYGTAAFVLHLREAVIRTTTIGEERSSTSERRGAKDDDLSLPTVAATLTSKLTGQETPLTQAEHALMQQWLTTLADMPGATSSVRPPARSRRKRNKNPT